MEITNTSADSLRLTALDVDCGAQKRAVKPTSAISATIKFVFGCSDPCPFGRQQYAQKLG